MLLLLFPSIELSITESSLIDLLNTLGRTGILALAVEPPRLQTFAT